MLVSIGRERCQYITGRKISEDRRILHWFPCLEWIVISRNYRNYSAGGHISPEDPDSYGAKWWRRQRM